MEKLLALKSGEKLLDLVFGAEPPDPDWTMTAGIKKIRCNILRNGDHGHGRYRTAGRVRCSIIETWWTFCIHRGAPAFKSSNGLSRPVEGIEMEDGRIVGTLAVKFSHYINPTSYEGVTVVSQPVLQRYIHRPMSVLLNVFFTRGFVADGIEEPVFGSSTPSHVLDWDNFQEISRVLAVRLRTLDTGK